MAMFDDLIPAQQQAPAAEGLFDDLIPAAPSPAAPPAAAAPVDTKKYPYSADNWPYDDNSFVSKRKTVNGVEYRLHKTTGAIYAPDGTATDDPEVMAAFGKTKLSKRGQARADVRKPMVDSSATSILDNAISSIPGIGQQYSAAKWAIETGKEIANTPQETTDTIAAAAQSPDQSSIATDWQAGSANVKTAYLGQQIIGLRDEITNLTRTAKERPDDQLIRQRLARAEDAYQRAYQMYDEASGQQFPQNPTFAALHDKDVPGTPAQKTAAAFRADPWGVGRTLTLQSGPVSIPSVAGGIIGSIAAGRAGAALGAGVPSAYIEAGLNLRDQIAARGADMNDPASRRATFEKYADEIIRDAQISGLIVGAGDAAGAAFGSGVAALKGGGTGNLVGKELVGTIADALFGAAGEGGKQVYNTGEISDPQSLIDEGLGEVVAGGVQQGGMMAVEGLKSASGKTDRQAPPPKGQRIEPRLFDDLVPQPQAQPPAGNKGEKLATPQPEAAPADPMEEADILRQTGYSLEQIADMNPAERAQATQEARQQGIEPIGTIAPDAPAPGTSAPAPGFGTRAQTRPGQADMSAPVQPVQAPQATQQPHTPGATMANGFKAGHEPGIRYRVTANAKSLGGKVLYEKRSESASPSTFYVGNDGGMVDANTVNVRGNDRDRLWTPRSEDARAKVADLLDRRGLIKLNSEEDLAIKDQVRQIVLDDQNNNAAANIQPTSLTVPPRPQFAPVDTSQNDAADKAFDTFIAGRQPITAEGFAAASGLDINEAGRAIQRAMLKGRVIQTRGGKLRRPPTRSTPIDAMDFIASIGGIRDVTGELAGMDLPKMGPFGPPVRKNGLHPDQVLERLVEGGYLQDPGRDNGGQRQLTVNAVYDLIARHMGGQKAYSIQDQAKADAIAATKKNENADPDYAPIHPIAQRFGMETWEKVQAFFAESGTSEETWSPQEVSDAARLVSEGMDAGNAFERAAFLQIEDRVDPESEFPEVIEWMRARDKDAMEAFGDMPPFPNVEAPSAVQNQPSEASAGVPPSVQEGQRPQDQANASVDAGQVPGARPVLGEEGQAGPVTAVEPGADNRPQTVIPGAEAVSEADAAKAAKAEKARKELEARRKQSKLRKSGQESVEDQDGGLFGGKGPKQSSLLDAPTAPEPKSPTPPSQPNRVVIETGVVLRTKSGRETSPAPKIDASTDRKATATIDRMNAWLLSEARMEAEAIGSDWQKTLLRGLDIKNFTQSDQDTVNDILFGDPDGPTEANVVRIDNSKKPKAATSQTEQAEAKPNSGSDKPNSVSIDDAIDSSLDDIFGEAPTPTREIDDLQSLNVDAVESGNYNAWLVRHEQEFRDAILKARRDPEKMSRHFVDGIEAVLERAVAKAPKTATAAATSAVKNTAMGLDDVAKGLSALFGGKNKLSSGFTFDEDTYAQALPFFKAGVAHFKAAGNDVVAMVRALVGHLAKAGMDRPAIENMRPYIKRFINDITSGKESLDAPGSSEILEPDSGNANAGDGVGAADVPAATGADGQGAGTRGNAAGARGGRRPRGSSRVSQDGAPVVGEDGNLELPAREPGTTGGVTPVGEPVGGLEGSGERLPDDRISALDAVKTVAKETSLEDRIAAQKAAEKIKVEPGSIDNIRATLPVLHPQQQDDVLKVEQRFAKPDGHGMLLTNGTGTGKTFSGLGVVKRFAKQGKGNILIVAPSQGILLDWQRAAQTLGLNVSLLESTQDAGKGIVATTYANLGSNPVLADRAWDLIVTDEAHKLSSDKDGTATAALGALRAVTLHPDGMWKRGEMVFRKEWDEAERHKPPQKNPSPDQLRTYQEAYEAWRNKVVQARPSWEGMPRSKVLMLSATPFAYHFSLDYAEGYLFNYPKVQESGAYNAPGPRDQFYIENFGYRMRTGKLTKPDANVMDEVMERQFHEKLKREGSLAGRALEVEKDYDRKFLLAESTPGRQIDEAIEFLRTADNGDFNYLLDHVMKRFDYLSRMRLLEAIKAEAAIPYIKKSLALGRKVVIFHDYNEGGGFSPFAFDFKENQTETITRYNKETNKPEQFTFKPAQMAREFVRRNPYVENLDFSKLMAPIATITKEFPHALVYNGTKTVRERDDAKRLFNDDKSGRDIIIVQSSAGEAGISLHDLTGQKQRVLLNFGMPTRPVSAMQQEGRIYRVGQQSDAIFRYMNTGTNWERWTFAQKIAERAGTAENLAMGDQSRLIKQSFLDAFNEADDYQPEIGEGKGGKEIDRRAQQELSEFDRAKTHYFAQQRNTRRRNQREGTDYFATPEPLGFKMVEWANVKPGEKILEPSAGHGAIARYFPENTARTLVESAGELASRAALNSVGARVVNGTFESLDVVNKYDAIVMNPPFGMGGKIAMEHLAKAAKHLRNGGRIVALIPRGGMADNRFEKWYEQDSAGLYLVANIALPGVTFERAGTAVQTRVVILEKQTDPDVRPQEQIERDYSGAETIAELFDRIENADMGTRTEPKTKETDVPTEGNVTVSGIEFTLRNRPEVNSYFADIKTYISSRFMTVAKMAEAEGGRYNRPTKTFVFETQEARQRFLDRIERGETPEAPAAAAEAKSTGSGHTFTTAETTHAKTGEKLFVATINTRVGQDEYARINAVAKKYGGWYSSFKGRGAIPGFQFKSEDSRVQFLADMATPPQAPLSSLPRRSATPSRVRVAVLRVEIRELASRILGHQISDVQIVEDMEAAGFSRDENAVYDPNTNVITIALDAAQDPRTSLRHEAIHALRQAGVFTPQEWAALARLARTRWIDQHDIRNRYERLYRERFDIPAEQIEELLVEEAIAEAFADYRANPRGEDLVSRIFDRVMRFLEAVANMARGHGYRTSADVFEAIDRGDVAGRQRGQGQSRDFLLYGRQASAREDVTKTEAFKKWFGASKVIDAQGRPLVVYHGTNADFGTFDNTYDIGYHFGSIITANWRAGASPGEIHRAAARGYMEDYQDNLNVMPVYLRIENPLRMQDHLDWDVGNVLQELVDKNIVSDEDAGKLMDEGFVMDREWMRDTLAAKGYDGIIYLNMNEGGSNGEGGDSYIVFSPTQIKSVFNNGTFDPTNPAILSSRGRTLPPPRNAAPGSFDAPHDERVMAALTDSTSTILDRIRRAGSSVVNEYRRKAQDREVDLLRTQGAITKASGRIAEPQDAYLAASLYPGRVAQRDRDLVTDIIEPLIADIARRKLTLDEVDTFNRARHAFERNIAIGQLYKPGEQFHEAMYNSAIVGGSGLSDDQAGDILTDFQRNGKYADLEAVGDKIVALNRQTIDKLLAEGLLTQEQHDAMTAKYQYYVPLRGHDEATDETHPDAPRTGSRYDVRGQEVSRAFGRTSQSDSPLAYSIMQARQAIGRIEKNRVGKRFLRLAQANPNEAFWQVNRRDRKKIIDRNTGLVRYVNDPGVTDAENVLAVKVGGQAYHITMHHTGLAAAMKGMGTENMHSLVVNFHKINRYLASMYTSYSPEFIFTNLLRDLQQTGIVLQEEKVKGITRSVLAAMPKAAAGMNAMLRGDLSSPWARYAREYADAGGKMGFMGRNDIETEKRSLERLMREQDPSKSLKAWMVLRDEVVGRLDRYNDSIENTLRLATYVALRNAGVSRDKAAFSARELTVNFNRKGEWSSGINAFYLFFNAASQGAASLAMRFARSKTIRRVCYGIMLSAFAQDMLNRMIAGDDDDGENRYDKIPDEIKARNGIVMFPKWLEDKTGVPYLKWPLPLGYNMFHVIGTQVGHAAAGARTPLEAAAEAVSSVANAFNPLGGGGTILNFFSPTLLDPAADIATNTNFFGENIIPRVFDETTPYAERYKDNVNPAAKWITETLSQATGGSPERKGGIDWSPEWVEHVWDFAAGGVGRMINNASTTTRDLFMGADVDATKVPFARTFVGQTSKFADRDAYYEIKDAVHVTQKEIEARQKEGDTAAVQRIQSRYARELRMIKAVDEAEKNLAKLRRDMRAVKALQTMGAAAKRTRIDEISRRMDAIQLDVRRAWNAPEPTAKTSAP